jgi:uncharacterized membrane protein
MTLDHKRLESLERVISRLSQELGEAQRGLAALRADMAPGVAPPSVVAAPSVISAPPVESPRAEVPRIEFPRPSGTAPRAVRGDAGLENMIGRYGALALAVLTIVMGAGALVSWAISHGMLGPSMRVTLGAVLALVIAGVGLWLRTRGSRDFGNALIALALAVINVVAWGAGPRLKLIPPSISLAIADVAAAALAALALVENEQLLYAVGLGGALIAPFVMATGVPHLGMLAAYGLIVIAAAIRTIGDRPWRNAIGLVLAGTVTYAVSVDGYRSGVPWIDREFAIGFAGVIGLIALLWERKPARPWIALCAAATMSVVVDRAGIPAANRLAALVATPDISLMALAGTAIFFAAVRELGEEDLSSVWALAVILVPVLFLSAALSALGAIAGPVSGSMVLAWGLAYSVSSLFEHGFRRGVLIAASGFAGLWAITLLLEGAPDAVPVVAAVYAVLIATISKQEKQPVVLLAAGASLLLAFWIPAMHLVERTGYTGSPFLSVASLGAASAVAAAYLSARIGLAARVPVFGDEVEGDRVGVLAAATLAFLWGHLELRRAFSPDVSTFALIAYYATCGVIAIQQGRVRGEGRLRQVGLSLAVLAALYAIIAASDVQQIGLRVGSYLLVGAFLLGVAWWYRGEGPAVGEKAG